MDPDTSEPKRLDPLASVREAIDAMREAVADASAKGGSGQAARQAKVAAALVLLEEAFGCFGEGDQASGDGGDPACGGGGPAGGTPEYGYGHPAHRPDPNATYVFDPGPYRLLPIRPDRRWRTPG